MSWIDEAAQDYRSRPWIAVALGLKVPAAEPLIDAHDAGRAIARAHRLDAIELIARRAPDAVLRPMLLGAVAELRERHTSMDVIEKALSRAARIQSEVRP